MTEFSTHLVKNEQWADIEDVLREIKSLLKDTGDSGFYHDSASMHKITQKNKLV